MMQWYAETYGVSLIDAQEAPWVYDWIKRNHNNLAWSDLTCRWHWRS